MVTIFIWMKLPFYHVYELSCKRLSVFVFLYPTHRQTDRQTDSTGLNLCIKIWTHQMLWSGKQTRKLGGVSSVLAAWFEHYATRWPCLSAFWEQTSNPDNLYPKKLFALPLDNLQKQHHGFLTLREFGYLRKEDFETMQWTSKINL